MNAPPVPEAPLLLNLIDAVSTAHVLSAAIELGLIDQLTLGPKKSTECADACATDPSMTALLLDALAGIGVVRREARGRYALAVDLPPLMRTLIRSWSQLSVVVRDGEPLVRADTAVGASDLYPDCLPLLSAMFTPAASRAAQLLASCGADVLDVGAGAAPWSIALARSLPAVRVTALDLPSVIATTQHAVEAANLGDRFDYVSGDMFTCELPQAAYDLVLLANVCHLFDEMRNRVLLRRLHSALRPGGLVAIIDMLTSRDPAEQRSISLYALGLRLRTSSGRPCDCCVRNLGQRCGIWSRTRGSIVGRTFSSTADKSSDVAPAASRSTTATAASGYHNAQKLAVRRHTSQQPTRSVRPIRTGAELASVPPSGQSSYSSRAPPSGRSLP